MSAVPSHQSAPFHATRRIFQTRISSAYRGIRVWKTRRVAVESPLMSWIDLPHTRGCIVCGRDNPMSLGLQLRVNSENGVVSVEFTPREQHIGLQGVVHGGVIATVVDEAMVWAATWAGRRFCVCGEMSIRFRHSAAVGQPLLITARVASKRAKLIQTSAEVRQGDAIIGSATGKYVPLSEERHMGFVGTFVDEPATSAAAAELRAQGHSSRDSYA